MHNGSFCQPNDGPAVRSMERIVRKSVVVRRTFEMRIQEALISVIANPDADFLITEDHSFAARVQKNSINVKVPNFSDFIRKLNAIARRCLG